MKKLTRKTIAFLISAALLLGVLAAAPLSVSAEKKPQFTLKTESNFFPEAEANYYDLSKLENEDGDIYITVEFKLLGSEKKLINIDIDELTWDPSVLEWKESYNSVKIGRYTRSYIFPFAVDNNLGSGMTNSFGNNNGGRIVGNFTNVMPGAWAYNEDGTAVTAVRAVFKLLDRNAESTTVRCEIDTLSLCDETVAEPYSQYPAISCCVINPEAYAAAEYSTVITPASQVVQDDVKIGDIDRSGEVTINDATGIQRVIAEMEGSADISDPDVFAAADVNRDGKVNVRDVTQVQRYLAGYITELG